MSGYAKMINRKKRQKKREEYYQGKFGFSGKNSSLKISKKKKNGSFVKYPKLACFVLVAPMTARNRASFFLYIHGVSFFLSSVEIVASPFSSFSSSPLFHMTIQSLSSLPPFASLAFFGEATSMGVPWPETAACIMASRCLALSSPASAALTYQTLASRMSRRHPIPISVKYPTAY